MRANPPLYSSVMQIGQRLGVLTNNGDIFFGECSCNSPEKPPEDHAQDCPVFEFYFGNPNQTVIQLCYRKTGELSYDDRFWLEVAAHLHTSEKYTELLSLCAQVIPTIVADYGDAIAADHPAVADALSTLMTTVIGAARK